MKPVSELDGIELDWWVAQVTGMLRMISGTKEEQLGGYSPSTKWAHGGPLIEREGIGVLRAEDGCVKWSAAYNGYAPSFGPTPLIAAMRALVMRTYGGDVKEYEL